MDTLTHAVLGAALGRVCFGQKLGWRAVAVGVIAAELPDADTFIRSAHDPLLEVEYHRHFTHSLAFSPVIALLATLPWLARARFRPQWRDFWLCAWLASLSHSLLDACTSYGTQLWWPLSSRREGWDVISIIDPVFTLVLLAGLFVTWWRKQRHFVIGALGFGLLYLSAGGIQRQRGLSAQGALAAQRGHTIERTEIMPTLGNNLVWRSLYLSQGRIYSDRIRVGWWSLATVSEGTSLPQVTARDLTATEAARDAARQPFSRFAWFSDHWLARSPADASVIGDMRYSLSTAAFDPIWGIRFTETNAPTDVEWVSRSRQRRLDLDELWLEITGRHPAYKQVTKARAPLVSAETGPGTEVHPSLH
jgi:inner membrane protein